MSYATRNVNFYIFFEWMSRSSSLGINIERMPEKQSSAIARKELENSTSVPNNSIVVNIWVCLTIVFFVTTALFAGLFGGYYTAFRSASTANECHDHFARTFHLPPGIEFDSPIVFVNGTYAARADATVDASTCEGKWLAELMRQNKVHDEFSRRRQQLATREAVSAVVTTYTFAGCSCTKKKTNNCVGSMWNVQAGGDYKCGVDYGTYCTSSTPQTLSSYWLYDLDCGGGYKLMCGNIDNQWPFHHAVNLTGSCHLDNLEVDHATLHGKWYYCDSFS